MERKSIRAMVVVKAAPVLTSRLEDSMCVAAISLNGRPRWIRLHPVPFRDLADESKFRKYQEVTVDAIRPKSDRRPESWTPLEGSIQPGAMIGTDHGWSTRRERPEALPRLTMCSLVESNRSGSGPSTPSLAMVRVRGTPELEVSKRDEEQLTKWRKRAADFAATPSLFDDPVGAHNSVVGADQGFRAPSWDQESVRDSGHEYSASAPIAAGQQPPPARGSGAGAAAPA